MRDKHWAVDTEAVANLVEAFRDELRRIFDLLPEFASIERDEKEKRFEKWAKNLLYESEIFNPLPYTDLAERLIMYLAIQDDPINFLSSILK